MGFVPRRSRCRRRLVSWRKLPTRPFFCYFLLLLGFAISRPLLPPLPEFFLFLCIVLSFLLCPLLLSSTSLFRVLNCFLLCFVVVSPTLLTNITILKRKAESSLSCQFYWLLPFHCVLWFVIFFSFYFFILLLLLYSINNWIDTCYYYYYYWTDIWP